MSLLRVAHQRNKESEFVYVGTGSFEF